MRAKRARLMHGRGAAAVVITGGHFDGADRRGPAVRRPGVLGVPTPRLETRNTHGTGCTFASAVAARLALGRSLPDAVARATAYVAGAMRHGPDIGHGHGPLDHFWMQK